MQIRTVFVTVVAVACLSLFTESIQAQGNSLNNNLFAQYYTQGAASQVTASMYPSPHWVPRQVGHTYNTYQPLNPHEMMYTHSRNYYNYWGDSSRFYSPKYGHQGGGSGLTKTTVRWQNGCSHMGPLPSSMRPLAGLHYKVAAHKYNLKSGGSRVCAGGGCRGKCHGRNCASGACTSQSADDCGCGGQVYGGEVYGGEVYGGEIYRGESAPAAPVSGCASGGCSARLSDETIDR